MAALLLAGMALGAPDSNSVVQASEILAKIEHGEPVEYDGVIVEGDLNFLEILVESPINITNSEFRGVLSFNNIFYKNVCLRKNEFNKDVYFGSQFKEYVDFGGCEFKGYAGFIATQFLKDTNFSEVIFVKDVRFAGANQRSAFYGFANFEGCQFNKIADFGGYDGGGTDFIGYVSFKNAIFNEDVSFAGHHSGASFNENANFQNARFGGNAYFSRSYGRADFKKGSDFTRAQFDGYVKFGGRYESANFDGPTIFDYVTFNDVVDFTNVIFSKDANFRYAQFKRDSDFIEAQFGSYSVFSDALFIRDADFRYAQFNREADFSDAKFGGYSVFSNAQFLGNVDFRNAKFDDNVYFENTSMNILYANETKFNGRVFISWKLIQHLIIGDYNREIAFYLDLMENYKKIGWFGDFNSCYYHYRQACRIHNLGFEKNTDTLEWIVYGYGVKPLYTLTWIIIFVMSFGLYFKKFDGIKKYISEEREEDPTDESTGGGTSEAVEIKTILKREDLTFIDPFLFSLTNFTSGLTSFLYPSVLYRAEKHRRLVILERLLGSVFLALLITAISKTYLIR